MSARLIYGEEERLLPWAAERIGISGFMVDAKCIGLEKDDGIAAVVVFDSFSSADCSMHVASDGSKRWLNRDLLTASFAYPFIQCGYESITSVVEVDRKEVIEFDMHIGWKVVGVRHKAAPGGKDMLVLEMLRAECRWIPEDFRK